MNLRLLTVALTTLFCSLYIKGQNFRQIDSTNYKDYIKSLPAFTMYGDNYFITGTSLDRNGFLPSTSDSKFEIGFKQRLTKISLPWDLFPFVTYRQKSFWNIYLESLPFRETNYNPSIGVAKLLVDHHGITDAFWFAVEHESNGRDGDESRSWNFISLTYYKPLGAKWQFRSKVWYPIGNIESNEDIVSYRGVFSVGASYNPSRNIFIDIDLQPAYKKNLTGFVKASLSFKLSSQSNQFIYLQYFGGYSEDLINYNQKTNNLRIGFAFKDLFANFRR